MYQFLLHSHANANLKKKNQPKLGTTSPISYDQREYKSFKKYSYFCWKIVKSARGTAVTYINIGSSIGALDVEEILTPEDTQTTIIS